MYRKRSKMSKNLIYTCRKYVYNPAMSFQLKRTFYLLLSIALVLAVLVSPLFFALDLQAFDKDSFFYLLEAQSLGGASKISGKDGLGSTVNNWLVSPVLKFSDDVYWINIYNGSYERSAQVVAQEEGGREAQTTQNHSVSTALKYRVNPQWSLRPIFFADWVFVKETKDESFGEGLYDYEDMGGGIESSWIPFVSKEKKDEVRLGFQFFKREYPNYESLLYLFNPSGSPEVHEKDFDGYKTNLSFDSRAKTAWSWGLEGISLYKDYTDKKTIDQNGALSPTDNREDFAQYLNGYISHPFTPELGWRLDGQVIANFSNLDFYDTHQTLDVSDDDFIKDYFDYYSFTAKPSITYTKNLAEDKNLILSFTYAFNLLYYPSREAQNTTGEYQGKNQEDTNHTFSFRSSYPLTKYVSWVAVLSYTAARSNQDFQEFYLYSYDRWSAVTGVSFKY